MVILPADIFLLFSNIYMIISKILLVSILFMIKLNFSQLIISLKLVLQAQANNIFGLKMIHLFDKNTKHHVNFEYERLLILKVFNLNRNNKEIQHKNGNTFS